MSAHEVSSVWQALNSLQPAASSVPCIADQLQLLLLHLWQSLAGIHPIPLHFGSILLYVISVALVYRVALILVSQLSVLTAIVVYAAFTYFSAASTQISSHAWISVLFWLALWFSIRYQRRPSIGIALWLSLPVIILLFVDTLMLGVMTGAAFAIIWSRGLTMRWRLPLLLAVMLIALIILNDSGRSAVSREKDTADLPVPVHAFEWLTTHTALSDAIILGSGLNNLAPDTLDYLARVYFPRGLNVETLPVNARRVWYLQTVGTDDPVAYREISKGRQPTGSIQLDSLTIQRFESPPSTETVEFENALYFHGIEVLSEKLPYTGPAVFHEGESIYLRLWWSVETPQAVRNVLRFKLYLVDGDGNRVATAKEAPLTAATMSEIWQPNRFYVDTIEVPIPLPMHDGAYQIKLEIYRDGNQQPISVFGSDQAPALPTIYVKSW